MDSNSVLGPTQSFEKSKSNIINSILIVFIILSFPLLAISLSKTYVTGWSWVYLYHVIAAMTAWILFIFRKRIGTYYMAIVMCLVLIMTACTGIYTAGLLYHAKIFFIVAAIFAGLFIGRKQGYFVLAIISLILIAFAFLYLSGVLQYNLDAQNYINKPSIWITFGTTLIAVTLGLQIITNKYVDHFILSEKQIRENQDLLKQSEERYRMLVETMNDGLGVEDLQNKLTYVNTALCKMLEYSYNEVIGNNVENFLDDKNREILRKQQELRRQGASKPYEIEWIGKNDKRVITYMSPRAIYNEKGEYDGSFAVITDITARKKAEEQLKLIKFGIDHSHIGVFQVDDEGNIYYANEHACKNLGYSSDELLGLKIWDIDPNLNSEKWKVHRRKTRSQVHSSIEKIHRKKNGTEFPVEVAINFIEFKNKKYSISFDKDITERKLAEQSIKESEERYRRLAEATFEGIGISKKGEIIDVNDQICSMYGYKPEEFKQLGLAKLVHPDDREMVLHYNINNITTPYTHRGIKKDGSLLYLEIRSEPIKINNEDCRLTVIRDITEYKKAEQALKESETRYRVLVENSIFPVVVTNMESKVLFANNYAFDFFWGKENKIDEYDVKSFWNKPDENENFINELRTKGKIDNFEFEVKTGSGEIKTVLASTRIIEYSGQQAFYNIFRDITERKNAKKRGFQVLIN
jgi:PAS domain S-box-containing protein